MHFAVPPVATDDMPVSKAVVSPEVLADVPKPRALDIWALTSHPETQPPWWLVPVSSGFTIVVQYMALGFDLALTARKRTCTSYFVKLLTNSIFVAMTLNTWRVDIAHWNQVGADHGKIVQFCIRSGQILSSGNFLKAMALWGSLFIQSPKAALDLTPKYKVLAEGIGFPLYPSGAGWLNPMKWLYAVLLLPYMIPVFVAQNLIPQLVGCIVLFPSAWWCV